jgi:hypothetical protein
MELKKRARSKPIARLAPLAEFETGISGTLEETDWQPLGLWMKAALSGRVEAKQLAAARAPGREDAVSPDHRTLRVK